jgi:hypothetical protein
MAGYLLMDCARGPRGQGNERPKLAIVALVAAGIGMVYYAVVFPLETTVAHLGALIAGVGIFHVIRFFSAE